MAQKYDTITELYNQTIVELMSPDVWQRFLETSCRNFRLSFDEQVLLFAQRADATAVMTLDGWNKRFGRWVNRGATGIAVFDDTHKGKYRLKHYFDIADTHNGRYSQAVPIWEVKEEGIPAIITALENQFDELEDKRDFPSALLSAAKNVVGYDMLDYFEELKYYRQDSFLEDLDDLNTEVIFRDLLENSVGYMLLSRCGISPKQYLTNDDFRGITNFNTAETLNGIGVATRDLSMTCLSVISKTALSLQNFYKKENRMFARNSVSVYDEGNLETEGRAKDEQTDIHDEGRLSTAESASADGRGMGTGEIRNLAAGFPKETSQSDVYQSFDIREAVWTSNGNPTGSDTKNGTDDRTDGKKQWSNRKAESGRSDKVDRADEQHQTGSGGNDSQGTDLQLEIADENAGGNGLPAFSDEQLSFFEFSGDEGQNLPEKKGEGLFQYSLGVMDEALCIGANDKNSRLVICAFFMKHKGMEENAEFLKNHYGTGGAGFYVEGKPYAVWYNEEGIQIAGGTSVAYAKVTAFISWEQAATRVRELLAAGQYMTQEELDQVEAYERQRLAAQLILTVRDFTEEAEGYAPTVKTFLSKKMGYPEMENELAEQLAYPEIVQKITTEWIDFISAFEQNSELLRFPFYRPKEILQSLLDLQIEPVRFTAAEGYEPERQFFISDDEVEHILRGANTKYRQEVYAFFQAHKEGNEREQYLKQYHGDSGVYGGNDNLTYNRKGLTFSHGNLGNPYAKVFLTWKKVVQRIEMLIATGRYILDTDRKIILEPSLERHDFRIADTKLEYGTRNEKYSANVKAIRCLKEIEKEDRFATEEEQRVLSHYVGWGGLAEYFDAKHGKYLELKSLLDETEYAAARASSLTAFYTPPEIMKWMYQALAQMGFQGGNILEPSCGVGNFIGMLPESMGSSKIYGVEIDSISGRIASQLYQNSSITVDGYENVDLPDSFFDVAIGNVPFGDFRVRDKRYDKHHWLIHDYFFGKTLDKVRAGGIIAFISSKGTMDKEDTSVRKYLAQRADLIGAIRLPNNAFKKNADAVVTSDILFLQKREKMTDIEPDWVHIDTDENGVRMNSYFVQHPEMILGKMAMTSGRFGMTSTCSPHNDRSLEELLAEAIQNLHGQITINSEIDDFTKEEDVTIPADPEVRNFSYTLVDNEIYYRENSRMHPVEVSVTAENRIRGLIKMRDCVRRLIAYQTEDYPDEVISKEQKKLNQLYDTYTEKYGLISNRGNRLAFGEDSSYFLLCSLEILDEEGHFKRKADMFTKRTIKPHEVVSHVDTASEALAVSMSEKAQVDMEYMAELSGKTQEALAEDLEGVIFRNVQCPENAEEITGSLTDLKRYPFVTSDEYLSGNVRRKLRMAQAMYNVLPVEEKDILTPNLKALEAVQPEELTAAEIGVRIGANWIPIDVYQQFMIETFGTSYYAQDKIVVLRSDVTGQWNITGKRMDHQNLKVVTTYGSKRMNAYQIMEHTLNQKDVRVFDYIEDEDGNKKAVLNKKETAIAQDRQEVIKNQFSEWIWKDIKRRERLCQIYNETFNSIRPREYDGKHIRFSGMNPEITLRPHQVNAIAHVMYGGNTLLAHEVGAGKTYEMVAAAMEMKRLGICSKSLVVVPNHITEQWAAEWLQLYPAANILVATKKDFEMQNRKKFCARIATGDYDAIIIGHSQFEKIPLSAERQTAYLQKQIDEIMFGIEEAKNARAERYTVKQLEKTRKSLEVKLAKLNDQSRKDDVVTFEELGVDRVFIDESHYFKNLFLATKMRNVGGIAQTEAQKSSDLFLKAQYLDELTGGKGVIFATGTPISNSMVELYTIQRYLQYGALQEMGLVHFDDWASDFGETVTAIELSPEGSGYRSKTRFAKFFNLPELMATFKQVADIQTADMLHLPVPKANFHTEVIKPSALQKEMLEGLAERAEAVRSGLVNPREDNMLRITNDGRKLALDMRLLNPLAADEPDGKVAACARNVFHIWQQTKESRSTQLIFCDLSTPKADGNFSVYHDLKEKLMERGIPESEIAFIHDAGTESKKKELFGKVRMGQIRVLMGSTQKMGAGTNVQDRLIALHDLDCPWRPSDLSQRLGRIVRQGNQNAEVEIYRYVTENTFDAYLYQLVENKQKFVAQIMTSKAPVRIAEDIDETALSYSEIKALATGNPLIIEKSNLDMEVNKLKMLKANYLNQKYSLENLVLRTYPEEIQRLTERFKGYGKDADLAKAHPKPEKGFAGMIIEGKKYTEKEAAGKAILEACKKIVNSEEVSIGEYRGFLLFLNYDKMWNEYQMTLKGALSHHVTLGTDVFGNITRMDNALGNLESEQKEVQMKLENIQVQLAEAKAELEKPFAKEEELKEKSKRLKEVNILLNMDEKDKSLLDDEPEPETAIEEIKSKSYER